MLGKFSAESTLHICQKTHQGSATFPCASSKAVVNSATFF